ncbi:20S proteasome subunit beta 2 [Nematocida parisii]|nr:proteasome component PUP1 [Nematocida parisii ERTm1]KAI5127082.1 20S proteasome subunit beta 2 [Nematocida parisii]EIJ94546.1 proteasome component PUP1 [Nematocida parisii ERTm1]KAI5127629.1 20S proteasome subunit beta 2 [Nematocida parisii]KAI5141182.1 20S proteasome subunit beta 2 [Nematocida parisii]KAI5142742.1 20S proteasome subunit beta 2 [Nematocida parisii]|eukprot:XP_013057902.1 proteasome component PUP1 [Nematocida parisii ERTm1]
MQHNTAAMNSPAFEASCHNSNDVSETLQNIKMALEESATKTGTTIVGVKGNTFVILAADTRSTNGPIIADKNVSKIHTISKNISCCGAGTAADTRYTTKMAETALHLFSLKYNRVPLLSYCVNILKRHLFSYQGHISASLILGGVDEHGPGLFGIHPHGSVDTLPYTAQGSGSYAAIGMLETGWKPDMSEQEAIDLACKAIEAGIRNDLYSGSNIDICIIRQDSQEVFQKEHKRTYKEIGKKGERANTYVYPRESVKILKEDVFNLVTVTNEMEVEY